MKNDSILDTVKWEWLENWVYRPFLDVFTVYAFCFQNAICA